MKKKEKVRYGYGWYSMTSCHFIWKKAHASSHQRSFGLSVFHDQSFDPWIKTLPKISQDFHTNHVQKLWHTFIHTFTT